MWCTLRAMAAASSPPLRRSSRIAALHVATSAGVVTCRARNFGKSKRVQELKCSPQPNQHQHHNPSDKENANPQHVQKEALMPKGRKKQRVKDKVKTSICNGIVEARLRNQGVQYLIGVDEAGRGPLAGPVVAAAVMLPPNVHIPGVADSKKLSAEQRDDLFAAIYSTPGVLVTTCVVDQHDIDRMNILQAALYAMSQCVLQVPSNFRQYVLVDGPHLPKDVDASKAEAVVKGDSSCECIAAASIIAKVTRDRLMVQYDEQYPQYGFAQHKGYGTAAHMAAIRAHGPCPIHRRSFEPIKSMVAASAEQG